MPQRMCPHHQQASSEMVSTPFCFLVLSRSVCLLVPLISILFSHGCSDYARLTVPTRSLRDNLAVLTLSGGGPIYFPSPQGLGSKEGVVTRGGATKC